MNKFNFNAVDDFDKHILFSIPNYGQLFTQVKDFVEVFQQDNTVVLDLGCSTGKLLTEVDKIKASYVGIDASNLIPKSTEVIEFIQQDLLDYSFPQECSVVVSMFLLQFLHRKDRVPTLNKIRDSLTVNGCFIVCEKTHYDDPRIEALNNTNYLEWKRQNFTDKEIMDKSEVLTRSMWLSTQTELEKELAVVGTPVLFWKSFSFVAYIVFKR